jgi:peptidylprolyl isomerase
MRGARSVVLTTICLMVALFLSACGQNSSTKHPSETAVTVSGDFGSLPAVSFSTPLEISSSLARRIVEGSGGPVRNGEPVVLNLSIFNARTGELARSTYLDGQHPLATYPTSESLFPVVQRSLEGARAGDRILLEVPSKDAFGAAGAPQYGIDSADAVLMVVDIMGTTPENVLTKVTGKPKPVQRGMPRVIHVAGVPTRVKFPRTIPRLKTTRVITLIDGEGPTIRVGNILRLNYIKQRVGSRAPVWDTWSRSPETFIFDNEGGLQAWQQALIGVDQGSRVMILVPNDESETRKAKPLGLAYVVDVLGVG